MNPGNEKIGNVARHMLLVAILAWPARGQGPATGGDAERWSAENRPPSEVAAASASRTDSGKVSGLGLDERQSANYSLGTDDTLAIQILEGGEFSTQSVTVGMDGEVNLPFVGRLQVVGLTAKQLEGELEKRLKTYIRDPQVAVSVTEFRSQPISILGAVQSPGVHQLRGKKTLLEVLSGAGGTRQDAGHRIKITRRLDWGRIPLPTAKDDPTGGFSVAEVDIKQIMEAENPAENIRVMPHDVISVPRANLVYVIGKVQRSGGFILRERKYISVLEALAMAGGLASNAKPKQARILRLEQDSEERIQIPINLQAVMQGKVEGSFLQADDILFVPTSGGKIAAKAAAGIAIGIASGAAIYSIAR